MKIAILIATFRRPSVCATLKSLAAIDLAPGTEVRVIVADNDTAPTARDRVRAAAGALPFDVTYLHAPAGNISIARNACLDAAEGVDWLAFVDDDEIVTPGWLRELCAKARQTGADAVFGPSIALYPARAPAWMQAQDHHSNRPVITPQGVETGHTCNALLRWAGTPWQDTRFDPGRGQSGGEDTAFFFALRARGATFAIAPGAVVYETVAAERLTLRWLLRRKFRMGQSYAAIAVSWPSASRLALTAGAKSTFCALRGVLAAANPQARRFWVLRGAFHTGVLAGLCRLPAARIYGQSA
ncbi:glycosyltransferase [Poseidonocella sedimentorum]|uniref:Succinoglycan biosynthesis protein ExoM n=1 Tax=Poseidonocella sedimentorum TaxID=871652 RepID=A0A1I6DVL3_9RHOB|nr:glycosyltransferase family 2 protein [Poseidonocella sedimentorum]SFR09529.1 succinoglycan biosynthesis protein ExoM [Poseidonocella sedimentorum]